MSNYKNNKTNDNNSHDKSDEEKKSKKVTIKVSKYIDHKGVLHEEIYIPEKNIARFLFWNDHEKKFFSLNSIIEDDIEYIPILDTAVLETAVLLPTGIVQYGNIKRLINEIDEHINKYVEISDKYRRVACWYILSTWLIDLIGTTSYLRALGDYGTGKSRFKRVIGGLCYKPLFISGAVTAAPVFRMIKRWGGTLVFDELDLRFSDETNTLVKILNCGNEQFNPVMRCRKDNSDEIEFFNTFGPKVFCTRKRFKDSALESRCLTEVMHETNRKDIPKILLPGHSFFEEEMKLRNKLLMFRLKNWNRIKLTMQEDIDFGDIEPRLVQDILSISMLFWNIPEIRTEIITFVQEYNTELQEQRANSFEGLLVNTISDMVPSNCPDGVTGITSTDISNRMQRKYNFNKRPNAASIGKTLRILGLQTKTIKINGVTKRGLVWDNKLMKILNRKYLLKVTEGTEVTVFTEKPKKNIRETIFGSDDEYIYVMVEED
jgi:hypothetical protein